MELHSSRGYESETSKLFMRSTVIVADAALFLPAVYAFVSTYYATFSWSKQVRLCFLFFSFLFDTLRCHLYSQPVSSQISLFLIISIQPALILIDHGHFQYVKASS